MGYVEAGLRKARDFLPMVSPHVREQCVRALDGRIRSAPLVLLLSGDIPAVASAAISGARLNDAEWAGIIPAMPTRARGFLRNRSDLGPETRRALAIWSSADFVLPTPPVSEPATGVQIRDIVERIERLRSERETRDAPYLPYAGGQVWSSDFLPAVHQGTRVIPGSEPIPDLARRSPSDRAKAAARSCLASSAVRRACLRTRRCGRSTPSPAGAIRRCGRPGRVWYGLPSGAALWVLRGGGQTPRRPGGGRRGGKGGGRWGGRRGLPGARGDSGVTFGCLLSPFAFRLSPASPVIFVTCRCATR